MGYEMKTLHGHNFYDMASMLQKAIRRGDLDRAGYAANELFYKYNKYLWKRLLVISAEDCYGIMTKEIVALKMADDIANAGLKKEEADGIFVSKALTLLCMARKNRDACYVACNFVFLNRTLEVEEIPYVEAEKCGLLDDYIPDWVYDVHTLKGKYKLGKDSWDMVFDEQKALKPLQLNLFDQASWEPQVVNERETQGKYRTDAEWRRCLECMAGKEGDPTHNGTVWPVHDENWTPIDPPKTTELHMPEKKTE